MLLHTDIKCYVLLLKSIFTPLLPSACQHLLTYFFGLFSVLLLACIYTCLGRPVLVLETTSLDASSEYRVQLRPSRESRQVFRRDPSEN